MINFQMLMKGKQAREAFVRNHPKVEKFSEEIKQRGFVEGQEIAIAVRYPDGNEVKTGIRVTESDLELLNMLKEIVG